MQSQLERALHLILLHAAKSYSRRTVTASLLLWLSGHAQRPTFAFELAPLAHGYVRLRVNVLRRSRLDAESSGILCIELAGFLTVVGRDVLSAM